MNYREIYEKLQDITNDFTEEKGMVDLATRSEVRIAEDILSAIYGEVKSIGLNFSNPDEDGLKFRVIFRNISR